MKKTMILAGALALALLAGCSAGVISSEDGPTQVVGVTTTADMTPTEQVELGEDPDRRAGGGPL